MKCGYGDIMRIRRVLTDPSIMVSADDAGLDNPDNAINFILDDPRVTALMPHKNIITIFIAMNLILFDAHIVIVEGETRKNSYKYGRQALSYMFDNTTCQKMICMVPTYNKSASMFAAHLGFSREGFIKESFLKDGEKHDQVLYGLTEEDFRNHIRGIN